MSLAKLANIDFGVIIMLQVNMFEAKSDLSKLIRMLETHKEDTACIMQNGVQIAKLTLTSQSNLSNDVSQRIGIAKGELIFSDELFDSLDSEIADMFEESDIF